MLRESNLEENMENKETKIPKDLGIKIGTPLEVLWTNVKKQTESLIEKIENDLIINKELLKVAKDKILLEQRK